MEFTNSGLVNYVKLSPNCTKPRNHVIDTISIHTMAGNLSVETCGAVFAPSTRQASSNYGIDSHGCVGMYVEEENRSWCTSNKANDMRAITIEVASINNTDYRPSEEAYDKLIKLCTDVCRRNNIKKLIWSNNKSDRINHVNGCNMTVHRDYKNKSCPGDWLYNHMGEIADLVNKQLGSNVVIPDVDITSGNEEYDMYTFLKSKGESNYFIFGLMGNLWAESGIRANNLQNSYERKLNMDDTAYTKAVDNKTYNNFVRDSAGYGYAQWTYWSRKDNLLKYALAKNASIGNSSMQRDFLWNELTTTYKGMLTQLRNAKSIREASDIVLTKFEKPADQSESIKKRRASYGENLFEKYAEGVVNKLPYLVRITATGLRIRNKPGTSGTIVVGQVNKNSVYTIVEENVIGDKVWGKLKSGAGWICLTGYTIKV